MKKLLGKWQITCWSVNAIGGWRPFQTFGPGQCVWEFVADEPLYEDSEGGPPLELGCEYDPEERRLVIHREEEDECFRAEFPRPGQLVLYDLDEVEVEPDDYSLRVELVKVG